MLSKLQNAASYVRDAGRNSAIDAGLLAAAAAVIVPCLIFGITPVLVVIAKVLGFVLLALIVVALIGAVVLHQRKLSGSARDYAQFVAGLRKARKDARKALATARTDADNAEDESGRLNSVLADARLAALKARAAGGDEDLEQEWADAATTARRASRYADDVRTAAFGAETALETAKAKVRSARADYLAGLADDDTDGEVVDLRVAG